MTPLRQRMLEDMQLRGFSPRTQEAYVHAEVRRILGGVRLPVYRACLTTIYVCGLRLLEGAHLQVADVDSARGLLHIHGKGRRDRYVPLPMDTLPMLRAHWRTHRSPQWVFPAPVRRGTRYFVPPGADPISRSRLQSAFGRARKQSTGQEPFKIILKWGDSAA